MYLSPQELNELMADAFLLINKRLVEANENGNLNAVLMELGLENLIFNKPTTGFESYPSGKIVIIGEGSVPVNKIHGLFKDLNIRKDRLELYGSYEEIANTDFSYLKYSYEYSLILAGPMPHKGKNIGDHSSILTMLESEGYPKVIRLGTNGLKISKSNIEKAIIEQIENKTITAD